MKKINLLAIIFLFLGSASWALAETDSEAVEKASLNYIEGFYEGDAEKLSASLDPSLNKFGFWKKKGSDHYENDGFMTFEQALDFARNVKEKKSFAKPDAPKKVELLDVLDKIAITKVTAWWGVDYILLAKNDGKWMIRQVLWEGPDQTASPTEADRRGAEKAGLGYVEGFYEGDSQKLKNSLRPTLFKYGYGYNRQTGQYREGGRMTYEQALAFADRVKETKQFPKPDAPQKVEVLDVLNHIAAVKVTAWWGVDYMLLSRDADKWMIEQVLWAGVPDK
ncbi:MAG: nuclear transport factor 2 family protein [Pyrinomonadaceae bacterium]